MPQTISSSQHAAPTAKQNYVTVGQTTINTRGLTPRQVLARLPKASTQNQRDSAIQAEFRRGPVKYNERTDTMTSFGLKCTNIHKFSDLKFDDGGRFAGTKYYHPTTGLPHNGVVGDTAPYTLAGDNAVTGLLIGCFVLAMIAFSVSRNFIFRQIRHFFYMPRSVADMTETTYEVRFQLFLILQTALLLGIIFFLYSQGNLESIALLDSPLTMVGIYSAIFVGYFMLKDVGYRVVNWVFFSKKNNEQWSKLYLFLNAMEGVLLFPIVLLLVYFNLRLSAAVTYVVFVVVFIKILTFYKIFNIFFKRCSVRLQIILYFCALEIMPLLVLWGVLNITANYLNINF